MDEIVDLANVSMQKLIIKYPFTIDQLVVLSHLIYTQKVLNELKLVKRLYRKL